MTSEAALNRHCCDRMRDQVEHRCETHENRFDCPDCLVTYSERFSEYGLIVHDGGASSVRIFYCPWCGCRLPPSTRT